jgi:chloride channel protein, CIC family
MTAKSPSKPDSKQIPTTLLQAQAFRFWISVVLIGLMTGVGAAVLTKLLEFIQHIVWQGSGLHILEAANQASFLHRILVLTGAGVVVGIGQLILVEVSSGNGIDITAAIWFAGGRLPKLRTFGSAILSVIGVAMGVSLGREGSPKQAGAVFANLVSDWGRLSDEQRRLLVACGAGAGMGAAYGVPLGGAMFALEVLRGILALRLILPALICSVIATAVSWIALPDVPTYHLPKLSTSYNAFLLALIVGPAAGLFSVGYIRAVVWAEKNKPRDWKRFVLPTFILGSLGVLSIKYPELLGNGSDTCQLLFSGGITSVVTLLALMVLKPAATVLCLRSGTPGGMFTPTLTFGALFGAVAGSLIAFFLPETPLSLAALLGAGAMLAAATQGPISSVILVMELTNGDRSFIGPLMIAICLATLVSRSLEPRSLYDAKLSDKELQKRMESRAPASN